MVAGQAVQPIFDGIVMENVVSAVIAGRRPEIVNSRETAANRAYIEVEDSALDGLDLLQSIDIRRVREFNIRPIVADTAC